MAWTEADQARYERERHEAVLKLQRQQQPACGPQPTTFERMVGVDMRRLHESIHAVIARKLGLHVAAMLVPSGEGGWTMVAFPPTPEGLRAMVLATLAPAAMLRRIGEPLHWCIDDLEQVARLMGRYRDLVGTEMGDTWQQAYGLLEETWSDAVKLARAIQFDVAINSAGIDAILGPAVVQQPAVAAIAGDEGLLPFAEELAEDLVGE